MNSQKVFHYLDWIEHNNHDNPQMIEEVCHIMNTDYEVGLLFIKGLIDLGRRLKDKTLFVRVFSKLNKFQPDVSQDLLINVMNCEWFCNDSPQVDSYHDADNTQY